MPFSIQPNPDLYAKLAAEWEAEETRRQHDSIRRISIDCSTYYHLMFFVIIMIMLQISVFGYRYYTSKRRQARREVFAQEGKDVEDVIAVLWAEDQKVAIPTDDDLKP